ncbi:phage holin family protein [Patescibacteria group bacterium]
MKIKKHFRSYVYNLAALKITSYMLEGVTLLGGYKTLFLAGLVLTLVNLFVRPLIKLLFLPVNLLTLGAFRWLINVVTLYLVTLIVPQFEIKAYLFKGYTYQGFVIPSLNLGIFGVFILTSFVISLIISFLFWLRK